MKAIQSVNENFSEGHTLLHLVSALAPVLPMEGDGFTGPELSEFFPDSLLFAETPMAINRVLMVRMIAVAIMVILMVLYAKRAKLIPGRAQAAMEMLLEFPKKSITAEIFGEEEGKRYEKLIATIFFGVLFMNITGVIPGLQIAGTSIIGMPLIYALVAYVAFIFHGIRAQGVGHFFKSQLFPAGVPWPLYIIMTPIELMSTFIIRPATLTIRLLANMMAGHLLLVMCFLGTNYLFVQMGGVGYGLGIVTFAGGIAFTAFELFIAALQAYIFALLTAVYIQLSVQEH